MKNGKNTKSIMVSADMEIVLFEISLIYDQRQK